MDPGGLRRVWKGQGGSIRSGRVREDPEGSLRFRKGPGGSGRIKEGLVGLGRVWKGLDGSGRALSGLGCFYRVQEGLFRHDGSTLVREVQGCREGSVWVLRVLDSSRVYGGSTRLKRFQGGSLIFLGVFYGLKGSGRIQEGPRGSGRVQEGLGVLG